MTLYEFHRARGARFTTVNGVEAVANYGDRLTEDAALRAQVGVLDLSFRSRLCVTGADRLRFLHGQVTNDIKRLKIGEGCYAALVTVKGRMESDLNIYCLAEEALLDFEPGLTEAVSKRLERYIVADDAQVVDVGSPYGLLSVQGPKADAVVRQLGLFSELPAAGLRFVSSLDSVFGEVYLIDHPRVSTKGFDLFVPVEGMGDIADKLAASAKASGGCFCGWESLEVVRVEAGIPRFGIDMDGANFPQECGIEERAVSYTKGCYIGQEVLNRIHTIGRVNRELRGLRLAEDLKALPFKGDKLLHNGKEVGWITSALASQALEANIALGYVAREVNQVGRELMLRTNEGETSARIVRTPF